MSEVTSVNGKIGAVTLAASDVGAVPTSEVGQPNGVASLNSGGELPEAQLPSSVVSGSQTGGKVVLEEIYLEPWLNAAKVEKGEDVSTEFAEADKYCEEHNARLVLPNFPIVLSGTIARTNVANREWHIWRSGPHSVIIDKNTTGPCLSYIRSDSKAGLVDWDFTMRLECQKPEAWMTVLEGLSASHSKIKVQFEGNTTTEFYKCRGCIRLVNMWEYSLRGTSFLEIVGHTFWIDNPNVNGGNVDCGDLWTINSGGGVIRGGDTTNNVRFESAKWVAQGAHEFYEKKTTGLPAKGAKETTVETGLAAGVISAGYCMLLVSQAGMDILHVSAYNSTTGTVKFQDEVTYEHKEDLRVICCSNWSVITDFIVPSLEFSDCHMEQAPAFLRQTPGLKVQNHQVSPSHTSTTGETHIFYLAGNNSRECKFENLFMYQPGGKKAAAVCPLAIKGLTNPAFRIDGVTAYEHTPSMANEEYRPFWSPDAVYQEVAGLPAGVKVTTSVGGVERDSTVVGSTRTVLPVLNTTGKGSAEITAALTGVTVVAGTTIRDTTNHIYVTFDGAKWYKSGAGTEIP